MYIETKRMIIRDFTMNDLSDLQEILGDDETMKNCEVAYTTQKTADFLQKFCIEKSGAVAKDYILHYHSSSRGLI